MSDSTRTILWIVAALVVIALVVWYFVRSARKRREFEERRFDAQSLRASADERTPDVRSQADRASVTERIAADARAEAQDKARRAEELEARAAEDQRRAEEAEREQAELLREADRIDPDVETDKAGNRVEAGSGVASSGVASSGVASSGGVSSGGVSSGAAPGVTGYRDDDEPDLADHENPFADQPDEPDQSAQPAQADQSAEAGSDAANDADWVNGPVEEDTDLDETAEADAAAADWINGPAEGEGEPATTSPMATPEHDDESSDDDDFGAVGEVPQVEVADVGRASARSFVPPSADMLAYAGAADGVMAGDDADADADADNDNDNDTGALATATDQVLGGAPVAEPDDFAEGAGRGQGDPFMSDAAAVARREISRYDEVVDGGYGIGSAAPILDGAQPLGHPVKAWRDSKTYAVQGAAGDDQGQPDVWFYDEGAARRAGFRPRG